MQHQHTLLSPYEENCSKDTGKISPKKEKALSQNREPIAKGRL